MDYNKLAMTIIEQVGGEKNIKGLTHCATRLRFNLHDDQKANDETLKNTAGVMGVTIAGGQYQVIIGSDVANVYKAIMNQINIQDNEVPEDTTKKSVFSKVIDTITGIFTPILPAITAAGMLKAVLSILVVFKVLTVDAQSYQILNFMADAAFYFLPILLAASSAQKFKTNMYLAMMLGGILLHPTFIMMVNAVKERGGSIALFGLPIAAVSYSSSVIPIILTVWLLSYVEPFADRISPNVIKFFSKPLISIAIVGTVSLVVLGPLGYYLSELLSSGIKSLETVSPWIVPLIIGTFTPLFIATGTHYGLVPIGINNRVTTGYDTVIYPGMLASNVSQGAASLAVGVKTKDKAIKQLAFSAGVTGIFGITEPALYGVNLRFKTPLYASMIGGGVGGLLMGILRVRNFSGGSPGLLTLPSYIGDNTLSYFYYACIGAAVSIVVTFILTLILYRDKVTEIQTADAQLEAAMKEPKANENPNSLAKTTTLITSPMTGNVIPLAEIQDGMFSEEILGKGMAIIPTEDTVYAPFSGTVSAIFDSGHAIGLTSETSVELLIHVGIDTVQLDGAGYQYLVTKGQTVTQGEALLTFDLDIITKAGYNPVTPVVITNSVDMTEIMPIQTGEITAKSDLMRVIK